MRDFAGLRIELLPYFEVMFILILKSATHINIYQQNCAFFTKHILKHLLLNTKYHIFTDLNHTI